uniref:Uncharacterized protein n=1 Tax=Glossina austeni TaxID=7395 RepID=A0A1A9VLG3_GLOAU
MSLKILNEIVDYIRRNPNILNSIDRQLNEFMADLSLYAKTDLPVSANEDPVLHTVQTVGRLSNKISRRVYRNVSRQIRKVQKGNVNDYLSSLIAALKLHQYINFINASKGTNVEQSTLNDSSSSSSNNCKTPTPQK